MAMTLALDWAVDLADIDTDQQCQAAIGDPFNIVFTAVGTAVDVSGWSFAALIAPDVDSGSYKTWADASFNTKTAGGAFTLSAITADTSTLPGRSYFLQVRRVDSGHNDIVCKAFITLSPSPDYAPITPPSGMVQTRIGGTGSDLSATGPGVLIQSAAGANVSILEFDSDDDESFLRKDGTYAVPAGSGGGSGNTDGGTASSTYGGTTAVDGGGA